MLNRRQLLRTSLASAGLLAVPRWARAAASRAPLDDRALVILQLQGGNDGLATLVPWRDERYRALRPVLAHETSELLRVDDENALHPALARLARRCERGQVSFVQNVGYPHPNLSHFRSMDVWDTAVARDPLPSSGWIGRLGARSVVDQLAIGAERLPRALAAEICAACAVPEVDAYRVRTDARGVPESDARARERLLAVLHERSGDGPERAVSDAYQAARASMREIARVASFHVRTRFPGSALGRDLEGVARILGAGLPTRVFHVAQSGYDTHTSQKREHAELLAVLDAALDAFLAEMEAQGRLERSLVMTISDFGRRAKQNGVGDTAGTDHGAASVQILCGGRVRGGVVGGQPDLEHLDAHGNLVHSIDFRQVYATVLERWLGADAHAVLGAEHACLDLFTA